jgi:Tannase and feruloyl esterase
MPIRILLSAICACPLATLAAGATTASDAARVVGTARLTAVAPALACDALARADLSDATGAATTILEASAWTDAAAKDYCRVRGRIAPAILFEVRLPQSGWTQRYLQLGCGGLCGNLNIRLDDHVKSCVPVAAGSMVLASTDMGHQGGMDGGWAAGNEQAKIDFAYRGVHLTALAAKALIALYYGRPARYAYFSGCSDGGREALMEAQRYPEDFDGIAAGAPALNFTVQNSFYHAWNARVNADAAGEAIIKAERLPALHALALKACDGADGAVDGLISDPLHCHVDTRAAQCRTDGRADDRAGDVPGACLSAAEATALAEIYAAAHDSTGHKLVAGGPMPGSELSWKGVFVPDKPGAPIFGGIIADGSVRNLYYAEALPAGWRVSDLHYDAATLDSFSYRMIYDATNPDLGAFDRRGGRLLMWHGWSDPHISPVNSIEYYNAVRRQLGDAATQRIARLFLIPGLYHCSGGDGYANFDILTPLMDWVEHGRAPNALRTVRPAASADAKETALALKPYGLPGASAAAPPALDWLGARYMRAPAAAGTPR